MAEDYTVLDVRNSTMMVGGRFQAVKVVSYKTQWGDAGEVEIPVEQFSADAVKAEIEREVAELRALHNL